MSSGTFSVKHEELPPDLQKYKGRVVVHGDNMKDESGLAAVFADAASSTLHIEASKLLGAVAPLTGHGGEQSDAPGACTKALLYGDARIDPPLTPGSPYPSGASRRPGTSARTRSACYDLPSTATHWRVSIGNVIVVLV